MVRSGLKNLTDHSFRREDSHSLFNPVPFPFINGQRFKPGRRVLPDDLGSDRGEGILFPKLEEPLKPLIRQSHLFELVGLFFEVHDLLLQHRILSLKVDQEEILLKDVLNRLDHEGSGFLERR